MRLLQNRTNRFSLQTSHTILSYSKSTRRTHTLLKAHPRTLAWRWELWASCSLTLSFWESSCPRLRLALTLQEERSPRTRRRSRTSSWWRTQGPCHQLLGQPRRTQRSNPTRPQVPPRTAPASTTSSHQVSWAASSTWPGTQADPPRPWPPGTETVDSTHHQSQAMSSSCSSKPAPSSPQRTRPRWARSTDFKVPRKVRLTAKTTSCLDSSSKMASLLATCMKSRVREQESKTKHRRTQSLNKAMTKSLMEILKMPRARSLCSWMPNAATLKPQLRPLPLFLPPQRLETASRGSRITSISWKPQVSLRNSSSASNVMSYSEVPNLLVATSAESTQRAAPSTSERWREDKSGPSTGSSSSWPKRSTSNSTVPKQSWTESRSEDSKKSWEGNSKAVSSRSMGSSAEPSHTLFSRFHNFFDILLSDTL